MIEHSDGTDMMRFVKNIEKYEFLIIYAVLLLFSGYYFFEYSTIIAIVVILGLLAIKLVRIRYLNVSSLKVFLSMLILILISETLSAIMYDNVNFNISLLMVSLVLSFITLIFANVINPNSLIKSFIDCVLVIALVSLITYLGMLFIPSVIKSFPALINSRGRRGYFFVFSIISDFGITGAQRNQGIFWEPGAFQMFLCLAYIFELSKGKEKRVWVLVVFLISFITTYSTTGIITALLLVVFSLSKGRNKVTIIRTFVITAIAIVAAIVIIPKLTGFWNYTLVYKIEQLLNYQVGSTTVASSRMDSVVFPLQEWVKMPVFGIGTSGYNVIAEAAGHSMFTCTPINWLAKRGLIYACIVIVGLAHFFKVVYGNWTEGIIALIIFTISISSENFESNIIIVSMCYMGYMLKNYKTDKEKDVCVSLQ